MVSSTTHSVPVTHLVPVRFRLCFLDDGRDRYQLSPPLVPCDGGRFSSVDVRAIQRQEYVVLSKALDNLRLGSESTKESRFEAFRLTTKESPFCSCHHQIVLCGARRKSKSSVMALVCITCNRAVNFMFTAIKSRDLNFTLISRQSNLICKDQDRPNDVACRLA